VQAQLVVTAVRDSGKVFLALYCVWCVYSAEGSAAAAAAAAANLFSVCKCNSQQSFSGCGGWTFLTKFVCPQTLKTLGLRRNFSVAVFCGPSSEVTFAGLNNFPLEISTDSVSIISNGIKGLTVE
jgi:hypothetical protein